MIDATPTGATRPWAGRPRPRHDVAGAGRFIPCAGSSAPSPRAPVPSLLEIARPSFEAFAGRHGYDLVVVGKDPAPERPPSWGRIRLMRDLLAEVDEILWLDADTVVVDGGRDIAAEMAADDLMGMSAHATPEGADPIPTAASGSSATTRPSLRSSTWCGPPTISWTTSGGRTPPCSRHSATN